MLQKVCVPMFYMAMDGSTPRQSYVHVHFNVMPRFVRWRYGTKILFL
jgi:hypothetical protein